MAFLCWRSTHAAGYLHHQAATEIHNIVGHRFSRLHITSTNEGRILVVRSLTVKITTGIPFFFTLAIASAMGADSLGATTKRSIPLLTRESICCICRSVLSLAHAMLTLACCSYRCWAASISLFTFSRHRPAPHCDTPMWYSCPVPVHPVSRMTQSNRSVRKKHLVCMRAKIGKFIVMSK